MYMFFVEQPPYMITSVYQKGNIFGIYKAAVFHEKNHVLFLNKNRRYMAETLPYNPIQSTI